MRVNALRLAAAAAIVLSASLPAAADVLELASGELVPGKAARIDDDGVTFVPEKGGEIRVPWDKVVVRCRYDLVRASLAADDAAGRVKLARWAAGAGLHRAARRDLLEAKGLGYAGPEDVDALLASVRREEADATLEAVDALTERGDLEPALERLRAYLRAAEPGPDADRVRGRVADLVQRIERRDDEARKAEEDRRKAEKEGRLKDWVGRVRTAADTARSDAGAAAADGFSWIAKGNQSRARDALAKAESRYQSARADYARIRKALKEGAVADECADRMKDCDDRTVEVLVRWGRLEVGNKTWKSASAIVDRGLRIDPVDRELLDLRAEIDRSWTRRKLSDVTNARGRESSF
jgi:tetratricopeptide (TPR) repeat protein